MAWSRASASSAAARSRSATRPSWVAIWSMRSREFASGGTSSAISCTTHAMPPPCRTGKATRLWVVVVVGDRLVRRSRRSPTPCGPGAGRADAVGLVRAHERHELVASSLGRRTRTRGSQPGVLDERLGGALQRLDQAGRRLAASATCRSRASRRVYSRDLVVGHHLVGDVLVGAVHPHRPAVGVALDPAEAAAPAAPRRRRGHPRAPLELVGAVVRRGDRGPHVLAVVGVDELEEGLVVAAEAPRVDAVDPVELVGPGRCGCPRRPTPSCRSSRSPGRWRAAAPAARGWRSGP